MPKIFHQFTHISLRDFLITFGLPALAVAALAWGAYRIVDPFPPRRVVLSTGQENSAYEEFGKRYAKLLGAQGIEVVLKPSLGSRENFARLVDERSDVEIAFVQSGSAVISPESHDSLESLGGLFSEPVWLFYRERLNLTRFGQLKGLKVNVGPDGTGVPALFSKLLDVNGLAPADLKLGALENTPATVELLEGRIDALVFSSAPDAPLIQMLLQTPGIKLFDFVQAEAYARRFPFLSHVVLPRGIVDFGRDIPPQNYHLIAPTATLVARQDMHPALKQLFVQAAAQIHGGAGWFHRQGDFPSANYAEIPVAREAAKYYRDGPPLLQRYLPFWAANFVDRMWVAFVALGALILPLSRIVPPLYVWKVRSRIYRWYGQLRAVEREVERAGNDAPAELCKRQLARLDDIENRVNGISIPLSFAEELYGLRSHIQLVRRRIGEQVK